MMQRTTRLTKYIHSQGALSCVQRRNVGGGLGQRSGGPGLLLKDQEKPFCHPLEKSQQLDPPPPPLGGSGVPPTRKKFLWRRAARWKQGFYFYSLADFVPKMAKKCTFFLARFEGPVNEKKLHWLALQADPTYGGGYTRIFASQNSD